MHKKISYLIIIPFIFLVSGCRQTQFQAWNLTTFWALGTTTDITIFIPLHNRPEIGHVEPAIQEIFRDYHQLTDWFEPHGDITNIYQLNKLSREGLAHLEWIEIDQRLFDLLYFAYKFHQDSRLSFNIFINELSTMWKATLEDFQKNGFPNDSDIQRALNTMNNSSIEFHEHEPKIKIYGNGQIDLGAVVKGYVVQLTADFLLANNLPYFAINSGSSSIQIGNIPSHIPINIHIRNAFTDGTFKTLNIRNRAIETSSVSEQHLLLPSEDGLAIFSHLINPQTGSAEISNFTIVNVIGDNSALTEILTTGFFHLSVDEIKAIYQEFGVLVILTTGNNNILYQSPGVSNYV